MTNTIGVVAAAALPAAPPERRPLRSRRLACARDRPPVPVADLADCPPSDTRWRRVCLRRSRLPSGLLQIRRQGVKGLRRSTAEKPNYRRRRLLCARRERPRRRAAEQRDEIAPFQLIELHSVPSRGRIAEYRIGNGQSGGNKAPGIVMAGNAHPFQASRLKGSKRFKQ